MMNEARQRLKNAVKEAARSPHAGQGVVLIEIAVSDLLSLDGIDHPIARTQVANAQGIIARRGGDADAKARLVRVQADQIAEALAAAETAPTTAPAPDPEPAKTKKTKD